MLKRLRVKNFKLLRDVEIEFADPLTVFIGPNAAGKSTVLQVLDFLRRCAADGLQEAVKAHGWMGAIRTMGATGSIEIETDWRFDIASEAVPQCYDLHWAIELNVGAPGTRGTIVRRERLANGEVVCVSTTNERKRVVHDHSGGDADMEIGDDTELAFSTDFDRKRFSALFRLLAVVDDIEYCGAISTASSWTRASVDRASARDPLAVALDPFLGPEGLGLANALFNLQADDADAWNTLEETFRATHPFVKRIVFPPVVSESKISFAYEDTRFPGRKTFASEMSDGMITFLALLVIILQRGQKSILALDDPDARLHPSSLRRLVSLCERRNPDRRIAIVAHSDALLDALDTPADVIRVVEPSTDGATIRKLDPEALDAWRKDHSLSELRRTGLIDRENSGCEFRS